MSIRLVLSLVLSAILFAACEPKQAPEISNPYAGQKFRVSDQSCEYMKVNDMWCLVCARPLGVGSATFAYSGITCDWSNWVPPSNLPK